MPFITTCNINRPYLRAAAALPTEHQYTAIGRPGRTFVLSAAGNKPLPRAIGPHYANVEDISGPLGEGEQVAARRPNRRAVGSGGEADSVLIGAVHIHQIDLL